MKAREVVLQLAAIVPRHSEELSRTIPVQAVTIAGDVATVDCAQRHGLQPGRAVVITGAEVPIPISSLTRSGPVGTLITSTPHDLTPAIADEVEIDGANEAEFNGSFKVVRIASDTEIDFVMVDAGPTTATGSPVLANGESALRQVDGAYAVRETPTETRFNVELSVSGLPNPVGSIEVRADPRVSASADVEHALDAFTEKPPGQPWLFVVLGDVEASKSRRIESDATDNLQRGNFYRQQLIQPFTLYLVIPADDEIAGRRARDRAEDLFRPICKSVLFHAFESGLFVGRQGPASFVSHGTFRYDGAVYVHAYTFAQVVDAYFEDTVGADLDVAFRQIDLEIFPDLPDAGATGEVSLEASIDLTTEVE